MGSKASKIASAAAAASARQFPARLPPTSSTPRGPVPKKSNFPKYPLQPSDSSTISSNFVPTPHTWATREVGIMIDSQDPDFAAMLQRVGIAKIAPSEARGGEPTHAPINAHLRTMAARQRIEDAVENGQVAVRGHRKRFVDIGMMREVLRLRDKQRMARKEIEDRFGIEGGVLERLGGRGILENVYVVKETDEDRKEQLD